MSPFRSLGVDWLPSRARKLCLNYDRKARFKGPCRFQGLNTTLGITLDIVLPFLCFRPLPQVLQSRSFRRAEDRPPQRRRYWAASWCRPWKWQATISSASSVSSARRSFLNSTVVHISIQSTIWVVLELIQERLQLVTKQRKTREFLF